MQVKRRDPGFVLDDQKRWHRATSDGLDEHGEDRAPAKCGLRPPPGGYWWGSSTDITARKHDEGVCQCAQRWAW